MSINEKCKSRNAVCNALGVAANNKIVKVEKSPMHGLAQEICSRIQLNRSELPAPLGEAAELLAKGRVDRDERILELKAKIRDGSCRVDATRVAEKIIQDMLVYLVVG